MSRLSLLIIAVALLTVSCSSGNTETNFTPDSFSGESVSSHAVVNLICGSQTDCLSNICADTEKCPLSIALSNKAIFDFVKTYSECEGCNTQDFSPDKGIGKCIEYSILYGLQDWIVKLWVSDNCSFRYGDPTQTSISVKINTETLKVESITPALEYIVDQSYCEIDTDCKCLSGSGVRFIGCGNFLHAPFNWSGYYSGDECECKANHCVQK